VKFYFFIFNKHGKVPVDHVKKTVTDFYTTGDIRAAKELLRSELVWLLVPDMATAPEADLTKHIVADLPCLVTHNRGDSRASAEISDLIDLVIKADEMNITAQLPKFVAASYEKVPLVQADDIDVCLLARRLAKLEMMVSQHTKSLIEMADKSSVDWPPLGQAGGSSWAETVRTLGASAGDSPEQSTTTSMTSPVVPVGAGPLTCRPETKISQHRVQK